MKPALRILLMIAPAVLPLGLNSCDSAKDMAKGFIQDKIDEANEEVIAEGSAGSRGSLEPIAIPPVNLVRQVSGNDLGMLTNTQNHVVLVNYNSNSCGTCRLMTPLLENFTYRAHGKVILANVDVEANPLLAARLNIKRVPDVRIYLNGRQVDQITGRPSTEVVEKRLNTQIAKLSQTTPGRQGATMGGPDSEPNQPVQRMDKDWMPAGIQRRSF